MENMLRRLPLAEAAIAPDAGHAFGVIRSPLADAAGCDMGGQQRLHGEAGSLVHRERAALETGDGGLIQPKPLAQTDLRQSKLAPDVSEIVHADADIPTGINMQARIFPQELEMSSGINYASRMKNAELARNIAALRTHLGKNQTAFADLFETQQPTVSKWESGQSLPEGENLSLLVEMSGVGTRAFCDTPWSAPTGNGQAGAGAISTEEFAHELGLALIDEVDLALGMGATYLDGTAEVKGKAPFRLEWLRGLYDGPIGALKVVQGRGDSMEPTIRDGDIVMIDTSSRRLDDQDMIWAVSYGDLGMIRRLRRLPSGALLMSPDNPIVRPTEAHDGECHIMGRVIFIGRRMG